MYRYNPITKKLDYYRAPEPTYDYERRREVFEVASLTGRVIALHDVPIFLSERVIVNGLEMTEGNSYDYTISVNEITFNLGVLPSNGHIKVEYKT